MGPELIRLPSLDLSEFIAGEAKLAMNTTSRNLLIVGQAASGITHGPTASGKSFVPNEVGNLFPPEEVIRAMQITTNALYYMEPGPEAQVGDRRRAVQARQDEVAEVTRALREMPASGR